LSLNDDFELLLWLIVKFPNLLFQLLLLWIISKCNLVTAAIFNLFILIHGSLWSFLHRSLLHIWSSCLQLHLPILGSFAEILSEGFQGLFHQILLHFQLDHRHVHEECGTASECWHRSWSISALILNLFIDLLGRLQRLIVREIAHLFAGVFRRAHWHLVLVLNLTKDILHIHICEHGSCSCLIDQDVFTGVVSMSRSVQDVLCLVLQKEAGSVLDSQAKQQVPANTRILPIGCMSFNIRHYLLLYPKVVNEAVGRAHFILF